ncbi:MAG: SOS response-associated peptidase family protein [Comamonadaceae bacterium]|nr:SOS response-associated peptidase family protein [Comamonadaceae bacterium]
MLMLYFILEAEPEPYNNPYVRPTNMALIIHVHDGQRLALPARWGLIPSWWKDDKIAQHTFNARAETIAEKTSFRAAHAAAAASCQSRRSLSGEPSQGKEETEATFLKSGCGAISHCGVVGILDTPGDWRNGRVLYHHHDVGQRIHGSYP